MIDICVNNKHKFENMKTIFPLKEASLPQKINGEIKFHYYIYINHQIKYYKNFVNSKYTCISFI